MASAESRTGQLREGPRTPCCDEAGVRTCCRWALMSPWMDGWQRMDRSWPICGRSPLPMARSCSPARPAATTSNAMRRLTALVAVSMLIAVGATKVGMAQTVTRPDLSGYWINQYTPDLARVLGRQPPFTAEGAARWRTVDTAKDPTGFCLPPGPSRAFTAPFPFQLVQQPNAIAILFEYFTTWRL